MKKILAFIVAIFIIRNLSAQQLWDQYAGYDFIPGENVIFYDDFSTTAEGTQPADWSSDCYNGGVMKISDQEGSWLKLESGCNYAVDFGSPLTASFTIEFDLLRKAGRAPKGEGGFFDIGIVAVEQGRSLNAKTPGRYSAIFRIYDSGELSVITADDKNEKEISKVAATEIRWLPEAEVNHIAIKIQNQQIRFYVNEGKVADAELLSSDFQYDRIVFRSRLVASQQMAFTRFRVCSYDPKFAEQFAKNKKLILHGIYFQESSNEVSPLSYPTLKWLTDLMEEDPSIQIKVTGYSDNSMSEEKMIALSIAQAKALKAVLTSYFKIEPERILTEGLGSKNPLSSNGSLSGKANNRRIEIIRLAR